MHETNYDIFEEIDSIKSTYESTSLQKVSGLPRSQYQVIRMCEYYSDSKYLGSYLGNKKVIGDMSIDVPFANIVNYRVSLAKTATDLDIKDIQVASDKPNHQTKSLILNHELYEWMKESGFSLTLNQMGQTRPKYGGYLVKKVETGDDIRIDVVRWTNVWTDQNDILGGPICETHHMSPVEIKRKGKVWNNVNEVLKTFKGVKDESKQTTIDVIELTGELPNCVFNQANSIEDSEDDEYEYSLQRYFVAQVGPKKYLLYSEKLPGEMTDYYQYLSWEENGYGLGRGVIEDCEEAQVWTNDSIINETLAMSLAGRAGIITDSKKIGNNILAHDHGKVYIQEKGASTTSFSIVPAALGNHAPMREFWRMQGDNVSSSFNSITGGQPPAGTPYSQTALLNQVATKPFEYKRQEWGIHLTWLMDHWIIPNRIKKINKEHILVSEYSDQELEVIDADFAHYNANQDLIDRMAKRMPVNPQVQQDLHEGYKQHLKKHGKKRYLEIPEGYFDDIEAKVTVITTGEQKNKSLMLQGLSDLMKDVIQSFNPTTGEFGALADPTLSKLFNERLELLNAGITVADIGKGAMPTKPPTAQVPQAPGATPTPSPMGSGMKQLIGAQ
jgi:hypothetical protein